MGKFDPEEPNLWNEETDPEKAGELMLGVVNDIWDKNAARRTRNLRHAKLWSNQDLASIYDCGVGDYYDAGIYLSVNVVEGCGSTLMAKLSRSKVRPNAITERGKRSLRRNAELITQLVDGVYSDNELHEAEGERIFLDGILFGSGWAYPYGDANRDLRVERVLDDEILIHENRGRYGYANLWDIYRVKFVHREELYRMRGPDGKMFGDDPRKRLAIKLASGSKVEGSTRTAEAEEMVRVAAGWVKASKPGGDDGRHLIAIPGCTLFGKTYKRNRLPFEQFVWNVPTVGVHGRSLAEQLVPIQLKINEHLELIDDGQRLGALGRLVVQKGTCNIDDFTNLVHTVVECTVPPAGAVQYFESKGAPREIYDDLETWIRRAYETTGVSMLSATGEKPEGVGSAVALRELLDREDLRFSHIGKRWERFHKNLGLAIIDVADELYTNAKGEKSKRTFRSLGDGKFVNVIEWDKIDTDRDKFRFVVAPASALPTTPGAKRQYAREMWEDGAISRARYLELMEEPDTKDASSRVRAAEDSIGRDLELILEEGKPALPDEFSDSNLALDLALVEYNKARNEEVEEDRLELLRRYIKVAAKKAGRDPAQAQAGGLAMGQAAAAEAQQQAPAAGAAVDPLAVDPMAEAAVAAQQPDLAAMGPPPVPGVTPVMG